MIVLYRTVLFGFIGYLNHVKGLMGLEQLLMLDVAYMNLLVRHYGLSFGTIFLAQLYLKFVHDLAVEFFHIFKLSMKFSSLWILLKDNFMICVLKISLNFLK